MYVNELTPNPIEVVKPEPMVGVYNVYSNQLAVRNWLHSTEQYHVVPFADMYSGVTADVDDRIVNAGIFRSQERFRHPRVLDHATGYFNHDFTKQLHREQTEPHWQALLEDERAKYVDKGTQLWLGMIAHIGGDLHRTVYLLKEAGFSDKVLEEYTSHDYGLVNDLLEDRAKAEVHKFVLPNQKSMPHVAAARLIVAKTAMSIIRGGRALALSDYERLKLAKSEDERQFITHRSQQRTAKVANAFLTLSYTLNNNPLLGSRAALAAFKNAA